MLKTPISLIKLYNIQINKRCNNEIFLPKMLWKSGGHDFRHQGCSSTKTVWVRGQGLKKMSTNQNFWLWIPKKTQMVLNLLLFSGEYF